MEGRNIKTLIITILDSDIIGYLKILPNFKNEHVLL